MNKFEYVCKREFKGTRVIHKYLPLFLIYEFLHKKIDPLVYLRCPVPMMKYSLYELDQILSQKLNIIKRVEQHAICLFMSSFINKVHVYQTLFF